ncbi:MAG: FAD:protein FMN transferase [Phaeovulum sp.]|uniref:FAD:protein FMN transferase n=1 Tax=Phaeovulum sp. TaxID=2934796 RepID=UPI00272F82F9|nr:FAD:protein FMN transferase [Phaeovulum sp.]MDP2064064.1 FAD:protein FMN transferase [Phaeovulum sp.]
MPALNRRRFLTISAAAGAVGAGAFAGRALQAAPLYRWDGVALGAGASITLAHPDAERIIGRALAEIARLEAVFSLYRKDSALTVLNANGSLANPPFELLECLALCGTIHSASGGLFDPTVQPLWRLYAESFAKGAAPLPEAVAAARALVGWGDVRIGADRIAFARPGMGLTLNGVAQGFIADRVAALLTAEGLTDVLVDTGEMRALGGHPDGGAWPVALDVEGTILPDAVSLREMALASSAPRGTTFDDAGLQGHILNPATGAPSDLPWRLVSVTAPSAALADALSSAFCLMPREAIVATLSAFPSARLVYLG